MPSVVLIYCFLLFNYVKFLYNCLVVWVFCYKFAAWKELWWYSSCSTLCFVSVWQGQFGRRVWIKTPVLILCVSIVVRCSKTSINPKKIVCMDSVWHLQLSQFAWRCKAVHFASPASTANFFPSTLEVALSIWLCVWTRASIGSMASLVAVTSSTINPSAFLKVNACWRKSFRVKCAFLLHFTKKIASIISFYRFSFHYFVKNITFALGL